MIGQSGLPMLTNLPPSQEQAPEDQAGKNAAGAAKDGRFAMALARSDGSGVHGPSGDGPGADKSGGEWHAPAPSATSRRGQQLSEAAALAGGPEGGKTRHVAELLRAGSTAVDSAKAGFPSAAAQAARGPIEMAPTPTTDRLAAETGGDAPPSSDAAALSPGGGAQPGAGNTASQQAGAPTRAFGTSAAADLAKLAQTDDGSDRAGKLARTIGAADQPSAAKATDHVDPPAATEALSAEKSRISSSGGDGAPSRPPGDAALLSDTEKPPKDGRRATDERAGDADGSLEVEKAAIAGETAAPVRTDPVEPRLTAPQNANPAVGPSGGRPEAPTGAAPTDGASQSAAEPGRSPRGGLAWDRQTPSPAPQGAPQHSGQTHSGEATLRAGAGAGQRDAAADGGGAGVDPGLGVTSPARNLATNASQTSAQPDGMPPLSNAPAPRAMSQHGAGSHGLTGAPAADAPPPNPSAAEATAPQPTASPYAKSAGGEAPAPTSAPTPLPLFTATAPGVRPMAASSLSLDEPAGGAAGPSAIAASTPARADAPVGPPPAAAADARAVTQQITQAIVRMEGARTEVTLDPVELGRISLTFVTKDDGVTVMVAADRPETADLLRRNGEQLQRDLSNAGYDGVELDFEQSGGGRDDTHQAEARNDAKASPNSPTQYRTIQIDTGLDIRI